MATNDGTEDDEPPPGTDPTDGLLDWLLSGTSRVAFATDECGRLTWWNDRLPTVVGRGPACLGGLPATELFGTDPAETRDRLSDALEDAGRVTLPVETADGARDYEFDGRARSGGGSRSRLYVGDPCRERPPDRPGAEGSDADTGARGGRQRRIVETVRDGVFTLDGEWNIVDVNRHLASMLGREPAALVGRHATELIAPDGSVDRAREAWDAIQREEVTSGTVELTLLRADGGRFPAEVSYGVFPLPDGEVGAVGVVRDVTEREERGTRPKGASREDERGAKRPASRVTCEPHEPDRGEASAGRAGDEDGTRPEGASREDEQRGTEGPSGRASGGAASRRGVERPASHVTREAREAMLRDARDRLDRLNRIGDAAAAALDPVLEAGSRDEVERRVCDRLADSDLYDVVWIGRPEGGDSLVPRTTAGADETFHEVAERLARRTDHERSANLAFRRGESVVNRDGWDAEAGEVVYEATGGRELRATMAIPLEYRGTTYGALTAYSTREGAFFEAEREALCRLGRAVGFAISAVGTRRLVHAHERAELEFHVGPESSVLAAVSAAVDAECVLRWTTPATDPSGERESAEPSRPEGSPHDLWLRVAVEGAGVDADAVLEAVEGAGVVEARVVEEGADGCTVDLRAPESVPGYVVAAGARPREVVADAGRARVVAEAPDGADVRSVVEAFTDATGAELVAKRRPDDAGEGRSISASLTEKQREALRTAAAMGYFDWPREHTAEEVADRLGVASATLHYHLRAAQRTLVGAALGATDDE
jgi:PAS domain S-box-containing protein